VENLEARLRELQEEFSNCKALVDHVGWKELMQTADEQVKLRIPSALGKVDNLFEVTAKEFEKGEISGIELFKALPSIRMEALEQDIMAIEKELEYDTAERTTSTEDGSGDAEGDFVGPAV
jgi:hypothetical protein